MKKIKIVHVITSLEQGGAQAVLYQLLNSLDRAIFEHTVIYFHEGPYVQKIQLLGIPVYRVVGLASPFDPMGLYRFGNLIKKLNPDLMHTLLWAANFIGRWYAYRYNIAHVQAIHNNIDQNGFVRNFLDRISSFLTHRAGQSIAVSPGVARSIASYAPWVGQQSLEIITNGVSATSLQTQPSISRASLGLLETDFIIGTVGRLEWVKNYQLLLTVFALIYDQHVRAYLVIVGSGSQERYLRKRAYDLGIDDRVIFVVGQDAGPYYDLFDCFVMTSYKEGISIALLEAMAKGVVPVVMADNGYHDVVEDHKNGMLAYSDNPEEFVSVINLIMEDHSLRESLAIGAKFTATTKFKIESMVEKYNALYIKMVEHK